VKDKVFRLEAKNGKASWTENQKAIWHDYWYKQEDGTKVTCTLTQKKPKRSLAQNRLYWLYLSVLVADGVGNASSPEGLHSWFKEEYSKDKPQYWEEVNGIKRLIFSTTQLTKGEFIEYMLYIRDLTEIPIPTQEWDEYLAL